MTKQWARRPPASILLRNIAVGLGVFKPVEPESASSRRGGLRPTGGQDGIMMAMFTANPSGSM